MQRAETEGRGEVVDVAQRMGKRYGGREEGGQQGRGEGLHAGGRVSDLALSVTAHSRRV